MRYATIVLAFALGALARPQEGSSTDASMTAAPSSTPSLTPQQVCLNSCAPEDVTCRAQCLGVARPNTQQVLDSTKCAMECDQGDGSEEDTKKYGDCQQACYASYFPSSQTLGAPAAASSVASSVAQITNSVGSVISSATQASTGTGAQPTGTSPSGSAASPQPTGAASSNKVHFAGLAGLGMAVFAL